MNMSLILNFDLLIYLILKENQKEKILNKIKTLHQLNQKKNKLVFQFKSFVEIQVLLKKSSLKKKKINNLLKEQH